MKRRLFSCLAAISLVVATGCSFTLGTPPEASGSPTVNQPSASPSPHVTGFPGAGRIAVLDASGTLTVFEADGSDPTFLAGSDPDVTLVRQPTWSRDGRRIAWVGLDADGTSATVMTAAPDGTQTTHTTVAAAPFYLSWDPTSARIVYLGGSATADLELGLVDVAASTTAPIDSGSPFYFSWAPKGKQLLVHVGTDRLDQLGIDGTFTPIGDRPGRFNVPVWTADGRTMFYVSEAGGGQRLVVSRAGGRQRLVAMDVATGRREILARFDGVITFVVSPDGERVAYQVIRDGPALEVPLTVIDRRSGTTDRLTAGYSPAFFWSPDGTKLLSLRPEVDERLVFRWNVWEDGSSFSTELFVPSLDLSRDYLQFFEQYAQSMTFWSPDGSAFVYAGQQVESGEAGIWVQPATIDTEPIRVADGVVASWSPG